MSVWKCGPGGVNHLLAVDWGTLDQSKWWTVDSLVSNGLTYALA